jgi:hypothetical protein
VALAWLELVGEVAWLLKVMLRAFGSGLLSPPFSAPWRVQIFVVPPPRLVARFRFGRLGALGLFGPPLPALPLTLLLALPEVFLYPLLLLLLGIEQVVERLAEAGARDDLGDHSASPLSAIRTPCSSRLTTSNNSLSPPSAPGLNRQTPAFNAAASRASSRHAASFSSGTTRGGGGLRPSAARRAHSVGVTPAAAAFSSTVAHSCLLNLTLRLPAVRRCFSGSFRRPGRPILFSHERAKHLVGVGFGNFCYAQLLLATSFSFEYTVASALLYMFNVWLRCLVSK